MVEMEKSLEIFFNHFKKSMGEKLRVEGGKTRDSMVNGTKHIIYLA